MAGTTETGFRTDPEAGSLRSRRWRVYLLSGLSPWPVDGPSPGVFTWAPPVCVSVLTSPKHKTQIGLGPNWMISFYLNDPHKKPCLQIQSHSEVWGLGLPRVYLRRGTVDPMTILSGCIDVKLENLS